MSIKKKINELFELRKLPELCSGSKIEKGSAYYENLIELQKRIYDLDLYLESKWELKSDKLDFYWEKINSKLSDLGVSKSKMHTYTSYIKKYQKHELQLREGRLPLDYTLEYYYFYKSCDVKLIRKLIYDKIPKLKSFYSLAEWRLFDLITEFHDDIEDVYEDVDIYNGNAFLISLNSKGLDLTINEFQEKINEIENRLEDKYSKSKKYDSQRLYAVTKEVIMHLNILLMNRKEELENNGIPQSKLLEKLSLSISI